ncbi:MAG UNVERIFIED_CONTAM: hypothetical protein LVT10_20185 [Anaerolineae bacterium]|jgi:hypothetical protein
MHYTTMMIDHHTRFALAPWCFAIRDAQATDRYTFYNEFTSEYLNDVQPFELIFDTVFTAERAQQVELSFEAMMKLYREGWIVPLHPHQTPPARQIISCPNHNEQQSHDALLPFDRHEYRADLSPTAHFQSGYIIPPLGRCTRFLRCMSAQMPKVEIASITIWRSW